MRLLYGLLVFGVACSAHVHAESPFVVSSKQNKLSKGVLKDSCNDLLFETLKLSPSMSMYNARLQQLGLDLVPAMLEGTFFSAMSTTELDACCKELRVVLDRQEKINALLEEQCLNLRALKKKYTKSGEPSLSS